MSKPRTGAPKRVAVGLLAGALAMFGVALAPPAGATATVTNERLAGATRYGTAAAIAGNAAFATPTTAIVATGENFPDALAASTLAGANAAAPIVLTQTATYTPETKAALATLKSKGVTAVTVVGGTSAVSTEVETAIKGDGFTVARVAGDDRYETAAAIAQAAEAKSAAPTVGGLKTAFIATGTNYPDALAAGPGAYSGKLPLLLVNATVPTETSNAIATLGIKKVIILGGTAAVSTAVEGQLVAATGNPATRLAGTNRFGTASAVGDYEITTLAFPATSAVLATGTNFPDALAAGPLGGALKAPIVLTASLPAESQAFLDKYSAKITKLYVSGGTASIDDATVAAATAAAQNTANDNPVNTTVTSLPELVSAAIVNTVTPANSTTESPAGTNIRYTFDEKVLSTTAGSYKVYNSNGTLADTAVSATVEAAGNTVVAHFNTINTTTLAGALSVATVDNNAALDTDGNSNPEGDSAIGVTSTSSTSGAAGVTAAPDLLSVGGFRTPGASSVGQTIIDFTFDVAAFVTGTGTVGASQGASAFSLVLTNGSEITCAAPTNTSTTGGGLIVGGSGTTTVTVSCNQAGLTAAQVARGTVNTGSVSTAATGGVVNPLEAAAVSTASVRPNLTSVTFIQGTTASPNDQAVYTFDKALTTTGVASLFCVYTAAGVSEDCSGTLGSPAIDTTTSTKVNIVFGPTSLDSAIGASVKDAAVTGVAGFNEQDEAGVTNAGVSSSITPGITAAPDLTSVALTRAATDIFGNLGAFTAVYTFDAKVATAGGNPANTGRFYLFTASGVRETASACQVGSAATGADNTVTCTTYTGVPATTTIQSSVLGTVDAGAVVASTGGLANPEGGAVTTGGNGTPVNP